MQNKKRKNIAKSLSNQNACLALIKKDDEVSSLVPEEYIDSTILINCASIVDYADLTTSVYLKFIDVLDKNLKFTKLSQHMIMIERDLIHKIDNNSEPDEFFLFEELILSIMNISALEEIPILLVLHNFDYLMNFSALDEDNIWRLRSLFQNNKELSLLATTKYTETFTFDKNPFYKYFEIFNFCEESNQIEMEYLLSNELSQRGFTVLPQLISYIVKKLDYNRSNIIQFLTIIKAECSKKSKLPDNKLLEEKCAIFISDFIKCNINYYESRLNELHEIKHGLTLFKNILLESRRDMNILEVTMLKKIRKGHNISPQNHSRVLKKLMLKGFLKRDKPGMYTSIESLFGNYITNNIDEKHINREIKAFLRGEN